MLKGPRIKEGTCVTGFDIRLEDGFDPKTMFEPGMEIKLVNPATGQQREGGRGYAVIKAISMGVLWLTAPLDCAITSASAGDIVLIRGDVARDWDDVRKLVRPSLAICAWVERELADSSVHEEREVADYVLRMWRLTQHS